MESYQMMQIGFYVCLTVAILFFAVSLLLYFKFDIRSILSAKTGKKREKAVRELLEESRTTGRMYRNRRTKINDANTGEGKAAVKKGAVRALDEPAVSGSDTRAPNEDAVESYTRGAHGRERLDPSVSDSPTVRLDAVDSAVLVQSATIPEVEGVRFEIVRKTVLSASEEKIK
ncbi:MAG: hypothetical protein IJG87_08795 [Ruminococcus sp.]|nr:hypothetical protein [Ruminococcus sp.]